MANALLTGVSGLSTHQKMIDVVGHNLANLNTTGFKSRRALFSDVFYETVKGGSGGAVGVAGGTNPSQIGNGSKLATVAVNHSQGNLEATGAAFDFALEGDGFFVVDSAAEGPLYTRAGAFGIDKNGFLVDVASGHLIRRFGSLGEPNSLGPAFQSPGATGIRIPLGARVPGQATAVASLRGNLSPTSTPATHHVLATVDPLTVNGTSAGLATLMNDLDLITSPYASGDSIDVTGTDHDGSSVTASILVDDTTTLQDLVDGISAAFSGATARLDATGQLVLEADQSGRSALDFSLTDTNATAPGANIAAAGIATTRTGASGEVIRGGVEVFDEQGGAHAVGIEMVREDDGTWSLTATIDPAEGTLVDASVTGITFNPDGTFSQAVGTGTGNADLVLQFANAPGTQTIQLDFGTPGTLGGLTSIAGESSIATDQDGFSTGTLVAVNVDGTGAIEGVASNGRRIPLAQMAIASFANPHGLEGLGNNFFRATPSSGTAEFGSGQTGGRGVVRSGQLEKSNVDIALEFTQLIVAQRGFSANARTITVTDEILEELTSLLR